MKKLHPKPRIVAAILLLSGSAISLSAQVYTAPFVVNGSNVSATAPGTYTGVVAFWDDTNTYSSISVGSGVSIETDTFFQGPINGFYATINGATRSLSNTGTLGLNRAGFGPYLSTVNLFENATSVNVTNSGTIWSSGGILGIGSALRVDSTTGNIAVTNSGTMYSGGGADNEVVSLSSVSGNISFSNTSTGTINVNGSGHPLTASTGGNGNVTLNNAGTINAIDDGIVALADLGATRVVNTGTIADTGAGYPIYVGAAGKIDVINNGVLSGTDPAAYGIEVQGGTAPVTITNNNTISGTGYGIAAFANGPLSVTNTGSITSTTTAIEAGAPMAALVVNNSGVITSTGAGITLLDPGKVIDSGNITAATTAISVPNGGSVKLSGAPVISGTISGGTTSVSVSKLTFNLKLPASQLAAARAQLNAEIADYAAQNGGDYTFTVDGLTYDVSNFDYASNGIIDALIAASYYANVPGFRNLGTVLDNLDTNGVQAARLIDALGNVSQAGLPGALSQLSPKSLEIFRNVAFDNNTYNDTTINNHLAWRRDGLTGFDASALSISDGNTDPSLTPVRDHLLAYNPAAATGLMSDALDPVLGAVDPKDMKDAKSMRSYREPADRWSTFIAGNVILANLDNSLPFQNANYTTGAVTAGADYRLTSHFTLGALVSYAHTGIDLDDRGSKATVDSYTPGIYGSYVDGGWYVNGLASYVRNTYTEDRRIDIPGIAGDNHGATSGNQATGNFTGGYEFQSGNFKFGPMASVQYVYLDVHSIHEDGTTPLDINSQSQDSLRSLIGFEGRYAGRVGSVGLVPHLSVSWQHEYLDNSSGIISQFNTAGGGSFSVDTDSPDRDSAFIDAGLDAAVGKSVTLFIDYATQVGQENFYAQSAQGGVRIAF